jgi:ABC-2 type transport system ATP-binding protein
MVHSPPVLVLDEPTAGVDVELRRQLWSYIRELRSQGTTILLTTHYLEEAEELCDQIAIIDRGRVVTSQKTDDLLSTINSKELIVTVNNMLTEVPKELLKFNAELDKPHKLIFPVIPNEVPVEAIIETVAAVGLKIIDLTTKESDLEDIFLMMTKNHDEVLNTDEPG